MDQLIEHSGTSARLNVRRTSDKARDLWGGDCEKFMKIGNIDGNKWLEYFI